MPSSSAWVGETWLLRCSSGAEAEQDLCSFIHSTFHEQVMHSESSRAALYLQRYRCSPTVSRAAISLVSQPRGQICSAVFFNGPRTVPPGARTREHTCAGQLVSCRAPRSSGEQSRAVCWVEPWTPICLVPCCLLNNQPVLPNAHHCLAAFCKPANMQMFTGPSHLFAKLLILLPCVFRISYEAR